VTLLQLASHEDWLLRPVAAQLCRYESLLDCTLDLADLAILNELIDVRVENEARLDDARGHH
jgi:hypothetical protein